MEAGLPPDAFWDQIPATYNAAMQAAMRARKAEAQQRRDLALMTAYFAGQLAQADWRKVPAWPDWLAGMTNPPKKLSGDEIIARFRAMAARGLDVTIE